VRRLLESGAGTTLLMIIMFIGSLLMWVATPLLWLWIGAQIQGATSSLGTALGAMFVGFVVTVTALAALLSRLSNTYRRIRLARGEDDPGHVMLEGVLVVSAGLTLTVFAVWFLFFAGAEPVPLGIHL
jgi:hypothetical protein